MAGLVDLGLIAGSAEAPRRGADLVAATCDLRPYAADQETWWVASDLGELATGGPLRTDHVLGVGGASVTLASWTPPADGAARPRPRHGLWHSGPAPERPR
jgi:hypothetical protein